MLNRRELLLLASRRSAALLIAANCPVVAQENHQAMSRLQTSVAPLGLTPFVDALPIPPSLPLTAGTVVVGENDGPATANGFPFGTKRRRLSWLLRSASYLPRALQWKCIPRAGDNHRRFVCIFQRPRWYGRDIQRRLDAESGNGSYQRHFAGRDLYRQPGF